MRKIVLASVVALSLGGCAEIPKILEVVQLSTKTIDNPVTVDDLYKIESGMSLAFSALNTYKRSCAKGLVDTNCRSNVAAIQVYTRRLPPLVRQLRGFVKTNDQVNARVVYTQVMALIGNLKSEAAQRGVGGM